MINLQKVIAGYSLFFIFVSFAFGTSQLEFVPGYVSLLSIALPIVHIKAYKALLTKEFLFIFIALFIILVSGYVSPHKGEAFPKSLRLLYRYLTVIFSCAFVINHNYFKAGLKAVVLGALCTQLLNFLGAGAISFSSREVNDAILSINGYAHNVTIGLFASFILYDLEDKKLWRYIFYVFILLSFLSFLSIASRQSLVVALFFIFILILLKNIKYGVLILFRVFIYGLVSLVVLLLLYNYLQDTVLVQRMISTNIEEDERFRILQHSLELFWQRPFIGYGPGTYGNYDIFVYTHSTPAELLFTGGVVYAFLYYLLFVILITKAWKLRVVNFNQSVAIIAVLITYLLAGQFYLFHSSRLALILFFLCLFYINTRFTYDGKGRFRLNKL